MCLYVTHIPVTPADGRIIAVFKRLRFSQRTYYPNCYITPSTNTPVHKSGILKPRFTSGRSCPVKHDKFIKGQELGCGFIHSYDIQRKPRSDEWDWAKYHRAYAFRVEAFEKRGNKGINEICSRGIYVPDADTTDGRKLRESACRKWCYGKAPSWATILKVFPEFQEISENPKHRTLR